ncbi:MAG TPA: guanylate kinase [Anaerolineaceae bacterium]|nr:guanylate kinase [Anaerolineaceae bacterium]
MKSEATINFDIFKPEPLLIVISGLSGVGKDTVLRELKERQLPFYFVVTATSRPPREDEREGVDYFFVSREAFESMIAGDELIEHAIVYNQYKGIPRRQIDHALASGKDVVLRVDVQGAERIRDLYPSAVLIFLIPATREEWLNRLQSRQTETLEDFQVRTDTARRELSKLNLFDYIVVNRDQKLQTTVHEIMCIIEAEHHRVRHKSIRDE